MNIEEPIAGDCSILLIIKGHSCRCMAPTIRCSLQCKEHRPRATSLSMNMHDQRCVRWGTGYVGLDGQCLCIRIQFKFCMATSTTLSRMCLCWQPISQFWDHGSSSYSYEQY